MDDSQKIESLEHQLTMAHAFHDVAVKERDYERHEVNRLRKELATALAENNELRASIERLAIDPDGSEKLDNLKGMVVVLKGELEIVRGQLQNAKEDVLMWESRCKRFVASYPTRVQAQAYIAGVATACATYGGRLEVRERTHPSANPEDGWFEAEDGWFEVWEMIGV